MSAQLRVARWLCPTESDRARLIENETSARLAGLLTAAAACITLLCSVRVLGWWPFGLFSLASIGGVVQRLSLGRVYRELLVAGSSLFDVLLVCVAAALTGGSRSLLLPWLVLPVLADAPRVRPKVLLCFTSFLSAAFAATLLVAHDRSSFANPLPLLVIATLFVSVTAGAFVLAKAELSQRTAAVLDPLTGLLNRKTLDMRAKELAAQAVLTGESLSCLVADIDFFKRVNDEHGHERGDVTLRQVAYELRKELGSFEPLYRIGGEEFLALLPGRDLPVAEEVGERLRSAASRICVGARSVTMSVGVATCQASNGPIDVTDLFRRADAAMYEAKRHGRNQVWSDHAPHIVAPRRNPEQVTGAPEYLPMK